ncbi:MAG: hypothetical protein ACYCZZ_02215 [Minisyncoccota bacterium]
MTRFLIAAVLILLAGYGLVEAWPLLAGPSLSIESPQDNASFPDGIVTIRGKALRIAKLMLDGASVLHDENGSFALTLTFPRGASILTFVATDQFGRHETITRTIFVPD